MPSSHLASRPPAPGARLWTLGDLTHRADPALLPELMDEPCSIDVLTDCLRNLASMNRLTLAYRPTLSFLARIANLYPRRELRVVDVGSGFGDTLRVIHRWAARRRIPVRLTGIDLNPQTAAIAREATRSARIPDHAIQWLTGDAINHPDIADPDLVISSLVTHHMRDVEIVRFLQWMDRSSTLGWLISDLERQPLPSLLFSLAAKLLRWHPFLHHDGPVSFRRSFRVADWTRLLRAADLPGPPPSIRKRFPARLCVEQLRHPKQLQ